MGIIFCLIEQQLRTTFDANFGDCIHFIIITIEIILSFLISITGCPQKIPRGVSENIARFANAVQVII